MPVGWGWNPETLSAIATTLAALAAISALATFWWRWRDKRDEAHHAKRRDAEDFRVWTEKEGDELFMFVFNGAANPVFDVRVAIDLVSRNGSDKRYAMSRACVPSRRGLDPVRRALSKSVREDWEPWAKKRSVNDEPMVEYHFRDTAGIWWQRTTDGRLIEITEPVAGLPSDWRHSDTVREPV